MAIVCRYCQRPVEPVQAASPLQVPDRPRLEAPATSRQPQPSALALTIPLDSVRRSSLETHYRSLSDESLEEAFALGPDGYQQPEIWKIVESTRQERTRLAESEKVPKSIALPLSEPALAPGPIEPRVMCANHATVAAGHRCRSCKAAICDTCTFSFPGELHLCPACATKPPTALTEQRRNYLTWSYVAAAVTTLTLAVLLLLGASAGSRTPEDNKAIDTLLGWVLIISLGAGLICGSLARPRGQPSPAAVRGALIWNWVLAGIFVLMMIVGLTMK
jgi:hypothetical protein